MSIIGQQKEVIIPNMGMLFVQWTGISVHTSLKNRSVGTSQSRGLSPRDLEISKTLLKCPPQSHKFTEAGKSSWKSNKNGFVILIRKITGCSCMLLSNFWRSSRNPTALRKKNWCKWFLSSLTHSWTMTCSLDYTKDSLEGISIQGWDIFCTEFWLDSESGLKIDLRGRISERSLIHF